MRPTRRHALPRPVQQLCARIEHWRRTRERRTRMPEHLWTAAAAAARAHGVYCTARALRVNYESLKHRAATATEPRAAGAFMELPALPFASAPDGTVVELSATDGTKLTIRLPAHGTVDVAELARALWSRRA